MAFRVQIRRDTELNWNVNNPILLDGEVAYESNTGKFKIGNGIDVWSVLPYISGGTGPSELGNFYYQPDCPIEYTGEIPQGSLWYNSYTGSLSVRINDLDSGQSLWVTPSVECCDLEVPSFFYRDTCPPIYPGEIRPGSLWFNNETGKMAVYIYDPYSGQYVWTTPSVDCCPMDLDVSMRVLSTNCDYSGDGIITFEMGSSVQGGLGPYSYKWSFSGNQTSAFSFPNGSTGSTVTIERNNSPFSKVSSNTLIKLKITDSRGNIAKDFYLLDTNGICDKL